MTVIGSVTTLPKRKLTHKRQFSSGTLSIVQDIISVTMNIIECGYCKLDVDINDRHPEYLRSKGISIPLYLHRSCASKINNLGENVWQFHKLSATYIKKQNTTAKLF